MNISNNKYLIEALYTYSASNHFRISEVNPSPLELLEIIKSTIDPRLAFKAAWALEHRLINDLELCRTYFNEIAAIFVSSRNWSLLRSLSKILLYIANNDNTFFKNNAEVLTSCFDFIQDRECPIAVRCNIYDILLRYCYFYQEIYQEVRLSIEYDLENISSAALLSRGKRVLKRLERIT